RTRTCPTGRGGWCAKASLPRPSGHGLEPRRLAERAQQRALLDLTTTHCTPHQELAVLGDVPTHHALTHKPGHIPLRDLTAPLPVTGLVLAHATAGADFPHPAGAEIVEAVLLERGGQGTRAGFLVTRRAGADHGGEPQPFRRFVLVFAGRPGEARATDE